VVETDDTERAESKTGEAAREGCVNRASGQRSAEGGCLRFQMLGKMFAGL